MQRARHENLKLLNANLDNWSNGHHLPKLSREAKKELIGIIESQANRVAAQQISLATQGFANVPFRHIYKPL